MCMHSDVGGIVTLQSALSFESWMFKQRDKRMTRCRLESAACKSKSAKIGIIFKLQTDNIHAHNHYYEFEWPGVNQSLYHFGQEGSMKRVRFSRVWLASIASRKFLPKVFIIWLRSESCTLAWFALSNCYRKYFNLELYKYHTLLQ